MSESILIVDPDRKLAEIMAGLFRERGHMCNAVHDGVAALARCEEKMPSFVILEGLVPKINGIELAKKIRALPSGAGVPILLVSAVYSSPKFRDEITEATIDDVLAKPFTPEGLLRKFSTLLKGSRTPKVVPAGDTHPPYSTSGSITDVPFVRLVFELYARKESGTLRLETSTSAKKLVTFEGGEPKFVVSNLERECLGQLLVKKGRLTEEECQRSIAAMSELKKRQGETLIQLGLIEPFELEEELKFQAREKFTEIFSWREGKYVFVPGKVFRKELTPVDLSIGQLCLRGVKEHFSLSELKDALAPFMASRPDLREEVFRLDDFKFATWDMKLVRQFKFGKTLAQVIEMGLARELDVYHLFYTLLMLDVIRATRAEVVAPDSKLDLPEPPMEPVTVEADPFRLLGVKESATDAEIQSAFDARMASLKSDTEAVWHLREAYALIGSLQGRRDYLLRLYEEKGKLPTGARDVFRPEEFVDVGKRFIEKKDLVGAARVFADGIEIFRENGLLYSYLGFVRAQPLFLSQEVNREEFDKWKKVVIRGTHLAPEAADAHYLMGRVFSLERDYEKAALAYRNAISLNPKHALASSELRLMEMRLKKKGKETSVVKWKE